ncbi:hypothetical protein ACHAXS_003444 [Conticribra weissflogii]
MDDYSNGAMTKTIVHINRRNDNGRITNPRRLNPSIAQGAFGHVDIALLVSWRLLCDKKLPFRCDKLQGNAGQEELLNDHHQDTGGPSKIQSVKLVAIKTIPNATNQPSCGTFDPFDPPSNATKKASLTREAFAELNALRFLNGHDNVTPLLGFYGGSDAGGGGGFGDWDWEDSASLQMMKSPTSLCLVFPYHPVDLAESLNYRRLTPSVMMPSMPKIPENLEYPNVCHENRHQLPMIVVQAIFHDILSALHHLHSHHILHRDLKPGNLYITMEGRVQLGDFGLAKAVPPLKKSDTNPYADGKGDIDAETGLCTLQYRPPELLFGGSGIVYEEFSSSNPDSYCKKVHGAIDIWSAGCILAELLTLAGPIFPGHSVLDQLGRIFRILGTPNKESWPEVDLLPDWGKLQFEKNEGKGLEDVLSFVSNDNRNLKTLLNKLLSLDPTKRPSALDCLSNTPLLKTYEKHCKDGAYERLSRRFVIEAMIPESLRVIDPIFFGLGQDDACDDFVHIDPLGYAKEYAAKVVDNRRRFLQADERYDERQSAMQISSENSERWTCKTRANGLCRAFVQ